MNRGFSTSSQTRALIGSLDIYTKVEMSSQTKRLIYFCGSIRGGRDDAPIYKRIIDQLKDYGEVLTEHIADPNIMEKEKGGSCIWRFRCCGLVYNQSPTFVRSEIWMTEALTMALIQTANLKSKDLDDDH